jgi:hypothetical protein
MKAIVLDNSTKKLVRAELKRANELHQEAVREIAKDISREIDREILEGIKRESNT